MNSLASAASAGPSPPASPSPASGDWRTIGLIGLAHGSSHFFHLLLTPLIPWLIQDFGLSYAELGLLVSAFFVVSGTGQAAGGFVVDRVGARPVLFVSLVLFAAAALAASTASGYAGLMAASVLAGLGNAPFHPVDFTILNKRVTAPRLGHAFSVHGISGNLGWAAAPVFLVGITTATGSWRWATAGAAGLALAILALLVWQRDAIDDRQGRWAHQAAQAAGTDIAQEHPMAFLRLPSVWLCFSFFFWTTVALSAIQSFASPALKSLYGLPLSVTSMVVTGYMVCGAVGMLAGGFLVGRTERLERIIGLCLLAAAALLGLVATGAVGGTLAVTLTAAAGLGAGLAGPSRDMLIKRASPPGATGRVYGTVYSGLDLGFAVAAPVLGRLMDAGWPAAVFGASSLALLAGVASAALVGRHVAGLATARR